MASYLAACSACTGVGSAWCGGAPQVCASLASLCAVASCAVASSSDCATVGAPTCGAPPAGTRDEADARSLIVTGVAASVVVGACVAALGVCVARCCPPAPATGARLSDAWRSRARRSFAGLAVGVLFHALGVSTGLAAPAVPWLFSAGGLRAEFASVTWSPLALTTTAWSGAKSTTFVERTSAGAIVAYISMLLNLPALALALSALVRVAAVELLGTPPPIMPPPFGP
jgi:hypothetical protein